MFAETHCSRLFYMLWDVVCDLATLIFRVLKNARKVPSWIPLVIKTRYCSLQGAFQWTKCNYVRPHQYQKIKSSCQLVPFVFLCPCPSNILICPCTLWSIILLVSIQPLYDMNIWLTCMFLCKRYIMFLSTGSWSRHIRCIFSLLHVLNRINAP